MPRGVRELDSRLISTTEIATNLYAASSATDHTNTFTFMLDAWVPLGAMEDLAFELFEARKLWSVRLVQDANRSNEIPNGKLFACIGLDLKFGTMQT